MNMISDVNRKDNFLDVILNTVSDVITLISKELCTGVGSGERI